MRMSDIAAELELEKGPAHRVLAQLCEQGWAEQDEHTSQYRLTLKLSLLGQRYLHGLGLPGLVQPILDEVAAQCRELVRLTVVSEGKLAWLASSQGAAPGLMYSPSMDSPITLHATANGKVWLASMSNDRAVECALRGGLGKAAASACGPKAITSIEQLIPELEADQAARLWACRRRGRTGRCRFGGARAVADRRYGGRHDEHCWTGHASSARALRRLPRVIERSGFEARCGMAAPKRWGQRK